MKNEQMTSTILFFFLSSWQRAIKEAVEIEMGVAK
jgi:hypothetical protein